MNNNPAFWKALHSLTHPLSIATVLLLLFNDHWLRHNYPSWLTGKLGDFTWLLFAPFIAALLFAWLLPHKSDKQVRIIGILSIAFIGLWFALAKTVPFFHWLTTETLYTIVGYRGSLRMDVTDLLTLPALLLTWHIWQNARDSKLNLRPIAYAVFGLGLLGTMATSYPPIVDNNGVTTVCVHDSSLILNLPNHVDAYNRVFNSDDGGFTWQRIDDTDTVYQENTVTNSAAHAIQSSDCLSQPYSDNITTPDLNIRWIQNEVIEISYDNGVTWEQELNLTFANQDIRTTRIHQRASDFEYQRIWIESVPASATYDAVSGNVIFAMGWHGLLVRTSDGHYHWVSIENYYLDNLDVPSNFSAIPNYFSPLKYHSVAIFVIFCLVAISFVSVNERDGFMIVAMSGWSLWALFVFMLKPPILNTTMDLRPIIFQYFFTFVGILYSIISIISFGTVINKYPKLFKSIFITSLLCSLAFILPFLMWLRGTIPSYSTTMTLSLILTACVLVSCYLHFKPEQSRIKFKRKVKEASHE